MKKRRKNRAEEEELQESLARDGIHATLTPGSGSVFNDGDLHIDGLYVESKVRRTSNNVVVSAADIKKIKRQSGVNDWAIRFRNKDDEQYVVISMDYLKQLLRANRCIYWHIYIPDDGFPIDECTHPDCKRWREEL